VWNENGDSLKPLDDKIKELVLSYPESQGLPDNVINNIVKIGIEQNKGKSDSKWFLKMLSDASKKYNQALEAKALKESKKLAVEKHKSNIDSPQNEEKILTVSKDNDSKVGDEDLSAKKTRGPLFKPDELEHLLPYIKNLRDLYPKLKDTAWFYILQNFGQWPLKVMSIFPERERLFPQWTVQAAATLNDVGLKKVLELGLEKDADALYQFLKREAAFYDHYHHRLKYMAYVRMVVKNISENKRIESKETDSLERVQK